MKLISIIILITISSCALPRFAKIEADAEIEGRDIQFDMNVSEK